MTEAAIIQRLTLLGQYCGAPVEADRVVHSGAGGIFRLQVVHFDVPGRLSYTNPLSVRLAYRRLSGDNLVRGPLENFVSV